MKIIQKIAAKANALRQENPVTIAFLGDSVTQGCFECYKTGEKSIQTVFERQNAYSTRLAEILALLYPSAQVNIINSGISGDNAVGGSNRLERDVLAYHPDLVVVSFGLNDSGEGVEGIGAYVDALRSIFTRVQQQGAELIFLTENCMNTHVSPHLPKDEYFVSLATRLAERQNDGVLKKYFDAAKELCAELGVTVCDLHQKWQQLLDGGADVTELLANKLNHPVRQMHYYMAIKLLETMFEN